MIRLFDRCTAPVKVGNKYTCTDHAVHFGAVCVAQNILRVRFGLPVLIKRRDLRFEAGVYIKCTRLLILLSVCQTCSTQKLLAKLSVGGEVAFLVHHGLVTPMVVGFES